MNIINTTTNKIIAENARLYKSVIMQSLGLIGRTKAVPLIFDLKKEKQQSIHMGFVFCSIDVLFLNKNKKIVEIKKNLKSFRMYFQKEKAQYIVELPARSASQSRIGHTVSFK